MTQPISSFLPITWDGPVAVVDSLSLPAQGWRVLAIFQEEDLVAGSDQVPHPNPPGGAWEPQSYRLELVRQHKCVQTRFLIGQTEPSAIEERDRRIAELSTSHTALEQQLQEVVKAHKDVEQALDNMTARVRHSVEQADYWKQSCTSEKQHRARLEEDLAKVRKAVGDLRWQEILNPGSEK